MAYKRVATRDLPPRLIDKIGDDIRHYSVGLVTLRAEQGTVITNLVGSGTLVRTGNMYAILTAFHVTSSSVFRRCEQLGLLLETRHTHRFTIPYQSLSIVPVGAPLSGRNSPDLSLVVIPLAHVSAIRARMLFWDLDLYGDIILKEERPTDEGAWVLFGCLDEGTEQLERDEHFLDITKYQCMAGFGGVNDDGWTEDRFDYLKFAVSYDDDSDAPASFGGCSGGGLWQVPLVIKEDAIVHQQPILSGVAFYQSDVVEDQRTITCHGRHSIYRRATEVLKRLQS